MPVIRAKNFRGLLNGTDLFEECINESSRVSSSLKMGNSGSIEGCSFPEVTSCSLAFSYSFVSFSEGLKSENSSDLRVKSYS